jgi:hypothetical protein
VLVRRILGIGNREMRAELADAVLDARVVGCSGSACSVIDLEKMILKPKRWF